MARLRVETNVGLVRREGSRQLRAHNNKFVRKIDRRPLAITLREGDKIVGGLVGETYWGWFFVEQLWVSNEQRGKGHGEALVRKAEAEARKRGMRHVYLYTYSFQAPGFYKKLGYRTFGKQNNFPAGHDRFWLMKAL